MFCFVSVYSLPNKQGALTLFCHRESIGNGRKQTLWFLTHQGLRKMQVCGRSRMKRKEKGSTVLQWNIFKKVEGNSLGFVARPQRCDQTPEKESTGALCLANKSQVRHGSKGIAGPGGAAWNDTMSVLR